MLVKCGNQIFDPAQGIIHLCDRYEDTSNVFFYPFGRQVDKIRLHTGERKSARAFFQQLAYFLEERYIHGDTFATFDTLQKGE